MAALHTLDGRKPTRDGFVSNLLTLPSNIVSFDSKLLKTKDSGWRYQYVYLNGHYAEADFTNEIGLCYGYRTLPDADRSTVFKINYLESPGNFVQFEVSRSEFEVCVLAFVRQDKSLRSPILKSMLS